MLQSFGINIKTVNDMMDKNFNIDSLEAYSFSILGYLRLQGKPSNIKSVTGAKKSVSLGSIILPGGINDWFKKYPNRKK